MKHATPVLLALCTTLLSLTGCSSATLSPLDQTVPKRAGLTALTIIAPQDMYLPSSGLSAFENYDYFLDCQENQCRVGKMHMLQYITIYPSLGSHTIYVKQAKDSIIGTGNIFDVNTTAALTFNAIADSRQFISHEWKFSFASLAGPFSSAPSKLTEIDEHTGQTKLQKVLDTTLMFGSKMRGYGEKGTTY